MRCLVVAAVLLLLLPTASIAAEAGENCVPVRVKKAYPPRYPSELEAEKAQGETVVRLLVGADGRVQKTMLETSSGHALMDDAAVAAMTGWEFEPRRCDGKAEASWALMPFRFDGSVPRRPAETVPDPTPLEFDSFAAGVSYLDGRAGTARIPVRQAVTVYLSRDEGLAWMVVAYPAPLDRRLILRWRSDGSTMPPLQLYRLLCDGPQPWCAQWLAKEQADRRQNPLPPPPLAELDAHEHE